MMGLNHISYSCGKLFTWSKFIFESENGSLINCIFRSSSLASFQHIWMPMWSGSLVVDIELLNWLEQGHSVRSEPFLHSSPPFLTILQALHMPAMMSPLVKRLPLSWSLDPYHFFILKMNPQYTVTLVWSALEFRTSGGLAQSMTTQL